MKGWEECKIWVPPGDQKYEFYSDEEETELRKINKMEEMEQPRECLFFGIGSAHDVGGE